MPFDNLFFFSDAGNGDLFCYSILKNGIIEKTDIYVWNHEDDSRTWAAASLNIAFILLFFIPLIVEKIKSNVKA